MFLSVHVFLNTYICIESILFPKFMSVTFNLKNLIRNQDYGFYIRKLSEFHLVTNYSGNDFNDWFL